MGLILLMIAPAISAAQGENSWSLASPNRQCIIAVSLNDGKLAYQVTRAGRVMIQNSPLGLRRDDEDFEAGLVFEQVSQVESRREQYELFCGTQPHVDHVLNHLSLSLHNANQAPMTLELAASDEGVAFRYKFPGTSDKARIAESELTSFALPPKARGWMQPYHAAGEYTPAYEDFYFAVSPGDPPPDSRAKAVGWAFPALFKVPDADAWLLLTEAGTDQSYCGCHLNPDCAGGIYRIAFPLANECTTHHTNKFGPEPRFTLPWTMPWRVIILGGSAGDIATSTLVTDLSAPSRIADISWIKPGRASWAWWSYPHGPNTKRLFNHFTDFAAKMKWEYTLFDAGWWNRESTASPNTRWTRASCRWLGFMPRNSTARAGVPGD